jgi:hypothetical protein
MGEPFNSLLFFAPVGCLYIAILVVACYALKPA